MNKNSKKYFQTFQLYSNSPTQSGGFELALNAIQSFTHDFDCRTLLDEVTCGILSRAIKR